MTESLQGRIRRAFTFSAVAISLTCARGDQQKPREETPDSAAGSATAVASDTAPDETNRPDSAVLARRRAEMDGRLRDIRALVAMAGVDSSHAAPFLAQLDRLAVEAYADRTPPKEADMTFVSALEQWIAAAHPLPDGQRAASLLAADQLLEGGLGHFGIAAHSPSADSAQKRLAALGAEIFYNDADADWLYTHTWLVEAARIDKGAVGTRALVWKLQHWCDVAPGGGDHTDEAVADARDLLNRDVNPETRALAHFLIGDAQLDIILLAHGTDLFTDSTLYRGREAEARRMAVQEYHTGLAIDSISAAARARSQYLRELLAGGTPEVPGFVCWRTE